MKANTKHKLKVIVSRSKRLDKHRSDFNWNRVKLRKRKATSERPLNEISLTIMAKGSDWRGYIIILASHKATC